MTRRLLIRLDAGPVGLGHAARVSGILAELEPEIEPILIGEGQGLADFFPDRLLVSPGRPLSDLSAEFGAGAVLVDLPAYPEGFFADLAKIPVPVICIDDVGGDVQADLIVNGTILEAYHRYPQADPACTKLLGGRYTLLRAAFGATPWRRPPSPVVTIVIGSGERAREWAFWLLRPEIIGRAWGQVTMVVGSAFADPAFLAQRAQPLGVTVRQGLNAAEMAALLSSASLCLITGGMILYEALAVGVPAVVFPQLPNLIPEAAWLARHLYIDDLGFEGGFHAAAVKDRVEALLADPEACERRSRHQRDLIDGQGAKRVAAALKGLMAP